MFCAYMEFSTHTHTIYTYVNTDIYQNIYQNMFCVYMENMFYTLIAHTGTKQHTHTNTHTHTHTTYVITATSSKTSDM
jgi:hypothetical protein